MRLTEWAEREGVSAFTVRRWIREGTMSVPYITTPGGQYLIHDPRYETDSAATTGEVVGYARVSSHDQKDDLQRQRDRVKAFLINMGATDPRVVSEIGSGMNGSRPKLNALLADSSATTIVVEHSDRLARMNLNLVRSALQATGRDIVVIDESEVKDDLVQEITEFMTSMCGRLYGKRSAKTRAERAIKAAVKC